MKKTLVSVLTTALVVGAASTTFAAANPFSDVPADHWACDAVTQLAKDGVVEGYGDSTYRGGQEITRYEMAQIVAKAMAKENISKADKALVDKLAAEFSDELNNLGVRVSNLEKKTDNVKWTGEARYTYSSHRYYDFDASKKDNGNEFLFRITPTAQINEHWAAKARIDYYTDMNSSKNTVGGTDNSSNGDAYLDQAYVQGTYGNTRIDLGKFPVYTEQGLVLDQNISGGQVTNTTGKLTTALTIGRYNFNNKHEWTDVNLKLASANNEYDTGSYQAIHFTYKANKAFSFAVGYNHISDKAVYRTDSPDTLNLTDSIWELGATYNFGNMVSLSGAYAHGNADGAENKQKKAYNIALQYKGAQPANKGSFGVYVAYRYLGAAGTIHPTYDGASYGEKGWEFGTQYTFAPNILGTVRYFTGKSIDLDKDASKVFARIEFFF